MTTEIEKTRQRAYPGEWQKWFSLVVSCGLIFSAMVHLTPLHDHFGVPFLIFLSLLVYLGGYNVSVRRLSKELVQEIDTLRRELEELKKRASNPSPPAP